MSLSNMSDNRFAESLVLRSVLQRCKRAEVVADGQSCGVLQSGFLFLIGFASSSTLDTDVCLKLLLDLSPQQRALLFQPLFSKWWDKVSQLRIFADPQGRMNESILQQPETAGFYLVSQFTLFADLRKGNRPGFSAALSSQLAKICFEEFVLSVRAKAHPRNVFSGVFAADMQVGLVNDGPVTLMFDCSLQSGIIPL
jgi:D-tyrosyl-tRNA(Tyr) deacylase